MKGMLNMNKIRSMATTQPISPHVTRFSTAATSLCERCRRRGPSLHLSDEQKSALVTEELFLNIFEKNKGTPGDHVFLRGFTMELME